MGRVGSSFRPHFHIPSRSILVLGSEASPHTFNVPMFSAFVTNLSSPTVGLITPLPQRRSGPKLRASVNLNVYNHFMTPDAVNHPHFRPHRLGRAISGTQLVIF